MCFNKIRNHKSFAACRPVQLLFSFIQTDDSVKARIRFLLKPLPESTFIKPEKMVVLPGKYLWPFLINCEPGTDRIHIIGRYEDGRIYFFDCSSQPDHMQCEPRFSCYNI